MRWCQLFSEPNAGSDAAAISTRATRVDGGWLVNGQKVWTSDAHDLDHGPRHRTHRSRRAQARRRHRRSAIDMRAAGVEVRPLREITGETLFNEVFFDDVFVPDDDVVGEVNQGWTVARATLGNERVSIGANQSDLGLRRRASSSRSPTGTRPATGRGTSTSASLDRRGHRRWPALNLRHVLRALVGGPPGPGGQRHEVAVRRARPTRGQPRDASWPDRPAVADGEPRLARAYLFSRCLTIAGGTSEINRNVIAERILGLPRDPLAR